MLAVGKLVNCINKSTTKDLAVAANLKVVPGFMFNPLDDIDLDHELKALGDEIVVKPSEGGSSLGLHLLRENSKLEIIGRSLTIGSSRNEYKAAR